MAFADEKPRSIVSSWGKFKITLAEACRCGDLLAIDASNNWDLANMTATAKYAKAVAGEAGAIGDEITAYEGAVLRGEGSTGFAAASGDIGDTIYACDTAGEYATSAGSSTQIVGEIISTNEIRVRITPPVQGSSTGWLRFDGVGYAEAGTYSAPVTSSDAGDTFLALWAKCTGAGHVYGQRLNIQVTNAAATTSNALRAELDLYHTSGHAAGGGAAIHAATEIGPTNTGHAGLLSGLNASIIASADTRSLQGTYAALSLQTQFKAGNTMPATTAFIYAADAGTVKAPVLLYFGQAAAASTAVRALTAGGNAAMTIAVNINGTVYYIPLSATAS